MPLWGIIVFLGHKKHEGAVDLFSARRWMHQDPKASTAHREGKTAPSHGRGNRPWGVAKAQAQSPDSRDRQVTSKM